MSLDYCCVSLLSLEPLFFGLLLGLSLSVVFHAWSCLDLSHHFKYWTVFWSVSAHPHAPLRLLHYNKKIKKKQCWICDADFCPQSHYTYMILIYVRREQKVVCPDVHNRSYTHCGVTAEKTSEAGYKSAVAASC